MRIASITAGAAGMFCGSCMKDNTLAAALREQGHDALLIPTYTPIRTDDPDVSTERVFFGGINVYLQEKFRLFRHTPWLFDRLLDARRLLRWVSPLAQRTSYSELGALTISMLEGTHGHQRKEVDKLADWLADDVKPEVVLLTNVLLSGIVPELKRRLGVPVVATLQGDDIFLDALPEPDRRRCVELIRENARSIDAVICTSRFYADAMSESLGVDRGKMHVVYPGISLKGHGPRPRAEPPGPPWRVGYYARVCPEKGFHNLVAAYIHLRRRPDAPVCRLLASGWLGSNNRAYFDEQVAKLRAAGLGDEFEYRETPDHEAKVRFLNELDVLSVPTDYHEPKGLYVLEAWANGVPVVQPRHGSFPELIEAAGGGVLVPPGDPAALADALACLLADPAGRAAMGERGRTAVGERFTAAAMARATAAVLERYVGGGRRVSTPFAVTRRVEFGDTDLAGIVHFPNFFRFMEAAETAFLRARGLTVAWTADGQKYGFPRVSVACDYQRPARFEDELSIAVTVERIGTKSVSYRYDITLAGEPVAVGRMTAVFARSDGAGGLETLPIPPDVRAKLEG